MVEILSTDAYDGGAVERRYKTFESSVITSLFIYS